MRFLVPLCLLFVTVSAGEAASIRSVAAPGPVSAIAIDDELVGYASGPSTGDCDRVRIWNLTSRTVVALGRTTPCERTSTGTGIATLSVAGNRALWLHYTGGNIREWSLFTATTTRRTPRRLAFVTREVDAPAPIVVGAADTSRFGDALPYAVNRSVISLGADGGRRFAWTAPQRVTALATFGGELAVASEGGLVTILDAEGRPIREELFRFEIKSVRLSGAGLFVQRGVKIELRTPGSSREWTISQPSRLEDALGSRAIYSHRGTIRLLSTEPYLDRDLARGAHAAAAGGRLVVADGRIVRVRPLP